MHTCVCVCVCVWERNKTLNWRYDEFEVTEMNWLSYSVMLHIMWVIKVTNRSSVVVYIAVFPAGNGDIHLQVSGCGKQFQGIWLLAHEQLRFLYTVVSLCSHSSWKHSCWYFWVRHRNSLTLIMATLKLLFHCTDTITNTPCHCVTHKTQHQTNWLLSMYYQDEPSIQSLMALNYRRQLFPTMPNSQLYIPCHTQTHRHALARTHTEQRQIYKLDEDWWRTF